MEKILQIQEHAARMKRRGEGFETSPAPNRNASYGDSIMAIQQLRPIRVEGNVAYVPLTQGHEAIIDAADVPLVAGRNWHAKVEWNTVYAASRDYSGAKQRTLRMHRIIMAACDDVQIDHRDGNGLNNRRGNLRYATATQNALNRRTRKDSVSGIKGVAWDKVRRKWETYITVNGKRRMVGRFETADAAAAAYARASAELHGEFGRVR